MKSFATKTIGLTGAVAFALVSGLAEAANRNHK
jgi:hypothetical protein